MRPSVPAAPLLRLMAAQKPDMPDLLYLLFMKVVSQCKTQCPVPSYPNHDSAIASRVPLSSPETAEHLITEQKSPLEPHVNSRCTTTDKGSSNLNGDSTSNCNT